MAVGMAVSGAAMSSADIFLPQGPRDPRALPLQERPVWARGASVSVSDHPVGCYLASHSCRRHAKVATPAMRILHAINSLDLGGAEQVVKDLARWQRQQGHEVRVVALQAKTDLSPRAQSVDSSAEGERTQGPASYLKAIPWLWRHRASLLEADVVHSHLTFGALVGTVIEILRDSGGMHSPVVIETDHSAGMPISSTQRAAYAVMRWRRRGIATVVPGVHSARVPKQTMSWDIPNGIAPLPQRDSWSPEEVFTLGSLGRLRADRRPDVYLDLLEATLASRNARLVYGGDGPYREHLEMEIRQRGLTEHVDFYGVVVDKMRFFNSIDVHVSLAIGSQVGLASLESASSATPSLAVQLQPAYSGLHDAIPSSSDATELSGSIALLADSEGQRRTLGLTQARYVREARSIDAMGRAYMAAYEAAMAEAAR